MKGLLITLFTILSINSYAQFANSETKTNAYIKNNQIIAEFDIPKGLHQTLQKDYFNIEVENIDGIKFEDTIYPEGHKNKILDTIEFSGKVKLIKPFIYLDYKTAVSAKIRLNYQLCLDNGSCLMPQSKTISLEIPIKKNEIKVEIKPKENNSIIKYLLMAFLGGLILNIMPCVLPVLSIKALSLVKQSGQDKRSILKHSLLYTIGIVLSFIILATVVIIMKKSGESVGWGFQFQNPYFVIILLTMMLIFALSLFDVFTFSAPGMQTANSAAAKDGYIGSFMGGVFAVLLATPCTAPMLGAALGFAFSQSASIILILFIAIGLGLASPFLLIGIFPKSITIFPKPGAWMNRFKELMGFLLLGTVIYLFRVLYFQISGEELINILWFMLLVSFSCWIYGTYALPIKPKRTQWVATIISILILYFSWNQFVQIDTNNEPTKKIEKHSNWQTFSPELLDALIAKKEAVFVDFSAEWCMTCKANELTVLNTDEIQNLFKSKKVHLLLGDNTKKNVMINEWLKKFNRAGVPLYLLYLPNANHPIVFPEILTKGMIINALK